MMLSPDNEAIHVVLPIIGRDESHHFYRPTHRLIFETLVDVYDRNEPIDLVVVKNELKRRELLEAVGDVAYLVQLAESVPSWVNAEHYAGIVRDKALLRELITATGLILEDAYADQQEAREILDHAEQKLFEVTDKRISNEATHLREFLERTFNQISDRDGHYITGMRTGLEEFDDITTGLHAGELIIVAARPSMGKTALGLNMAEFLAVEDKKAVAFFSMEMSKQQLAERILCSRGRFDSNRLRKGTLSEEEIHSMGMLCEDLKAVPMLVDDTPGMSLLELRAKARRLKLRHDVQIIFVDYLQLMHIPKSESRQQEISTISRGLKALARELNIPVVALAQLNRGPEGRDGHKPRMSDLRESGAIEQDADVILLIHREGYYRRDDPTIQNVAELILAKQRNGPTGSIKVHFDQKFTRFSNLSFAPDPGGYVESGAAPF
jgi:replicative DNA helicase